MERHRLLGLLVRGYVISLGIASLVAVVWLLVPRAGSAFSSPLVAGLYFAAAAFGILVLGFLLAFYAER